MSETGNGTTNDKTDEAKELAREFGIAEKWIIGTNICLAVIGLFALCIYHGQLNALLESNKINRDSLTSVQRAFVTFKGIQLDTPPVSLNPKTIAWVFSGLVENSGVTPAINKVEYLSGSNELSGEPSEEIFVGSEKDRQIGEIGPKAEEHVGQLIKKNDFIMGDYALSPATIADEKFQSFLRTRLVFLWGWVAYRDIFPHTSPHVTEFCKRLTAIGLASNLTPGLEFSECRQHNCVDEHCSDYKTIADMVPE